MTAIKNIAAVVAAAVAMWLLMVAFVDAYDAECASREATAKRIVSYGVVR